MTTSSTPETSLLGLRVLVLGGGGFIGSHLTDALLGAGASVRILDRPLVRQNFAVDKKRSGLEVHEGDFTSAIDVEYAIEGVDICVHLVSTTLPKSSNLDPVYDAQTNLLASIGLIEAASRAGVRKIVFASSGGTVYGVPKTVPISEEHATDPLCAYGITKLAIEKHLELARRLRGLEYAALRIANPYGERQRPEASQGAVAVFLHRALHGLPIEVWGDGQVVRDFVYIGDVVSALMRAMVVDAVDDEPRVFNIGSGQGVSLNELLAAIRITIGREFAVNYQPARAFDVPVNVLDIQRARHLLGWAPQVPLADGLARFRAWMVRDGQHVVDPGDSAAPTRP